MTCFKFITEHMQVRMYFSTSHNNQHTQLAITYNLTASTEASAGPLNKRRPDSIVDGTLAQEQLKFSDSHHLVKQFVQRFAKRGSGQMEAPAEQQGVAVVIKNRVRKLRGAAMENLCGCFLEKRYGQGSIHS